MASIDAVLCVSGADVASLSDTVNLTRDAACLYVGTGGDVKIMAPDGSTMTFVAVPTGSLIPFRVRRIYSTGTTASDFVVGYLD